MDQFRVIENQVVCTGLFQNHMNLKILVDRGKSAGQHRGSTMLLTPRVQATNASFKTKLKGENKDSNPTIQNRCTVNVGVSRSR
jgi:hypothetical protein